MWKIIIFLVTCSASVRTCSAEKILFFFGGGSYSMKNSVWPWATGLADRGHEVTFLSAHDRKPTEHPGVRDLAPETLKALTKSLYDVDRFQQRRNGEEKLVITGYSKASVAICETIFFKSKTDKVLQELFQNVNFDLVIVNIIHGECGLVVGHKFKAKTITFDGTIVLPWFFDVFGFHPDTSWIPDLLIKYDQFPLGFMDRALNTIWPLYWYYERHWVIYPGLEDIMQRLYDREDVPSVYDLERNTSLVVVNSHPGTDFAYSLPPCVVQIGGMQAWLPIKQIPLVFKEFLDSAGPQGVVLISFGSTISLEKLPDDFRDIFFNVMAKHRNVRFIIRWNGTLPEFLSGNVLATAWLPQREILSHPKVKAFMTHAGMNSIQEATYYGIPLIAVPLFADQDYNAFRVDVQKVGFRLEIRDLTFKMLDDAIQKILTDPEYKRNMEIKSKIFRDRPQPPVDTILYWTEFVLRNDDVSALKPMSSHLSWFQRRLLDVYALYGLLLAVIIYVLIIVVKIMIRIVHVWFDNPKQKVS